MLRPEAILNLGGLNLFFNFSYSAAEQSVTDCISERISLRFFEKSVPDGGGVRHDAAGRINFSGCQYYDG